MPDERLRILVVDDSALVRQVLCAIIDAQPDMQAVGTAGDAAAARSRIAALAPDALTLDIQLPGMNGLDFLRELAGGPPLPVLIVATPTEAEVQVARQARALGACDVLPKPRLGVAQGLRDDGDAICQALRQAV
ncbi:MAG: response regulator, partial [Pseudacidovorax sp.]|nr:response regulator [Pseudacidovorax sp.]